MGADVNQGETRHRRFNGGKNDRLMKKKTTEKKRLKPRELFLPFSLRRNKIVFTMFDDFNEINENY